MPRGHPVKSPYKGEIVIEIPMHCTQCYARTKWMHDYIWDSFRYWSYGHVGLCAILGADPGPLRREKIRKLWEVLAEYVGKLKKVHPNCRSTN